MGDASWHARLDWLEESRAGQVVQVEAEIATLQRDERVEKFQDPDWTAKGERRASVPQTRLATLWINTGTLCNITCRNCYIESSPTNDRIAYISTAEVTAYLNEIATLDLGTREIGFTGGEPFLNPDFLTILEETLRRGFDVLVLSNGMQPMLRSRVKQRLMALKEVHGARLKIRISLDHFTKLLHESERGPGSWVKVCEGLGWLTANGFNMAIAGRTCWGESLEEARAGYAALISEKGWSVDVNNSDQLTLLPEMDGRVEVPEITTACWGILHKDPGDVMCATSRMIVKRKGAATPTVLPCTLLPYDSAFEMGTTLAEAARADGGMFTHGSVKLCHVNCAKFCVLGGGSCS